ncbi:DUF6172 family protein [Aestuariirhabdus sp. Z084]|uniref:DUF6172 family protein n=1 Tax=Aestuariirhabdus haliotis TaxID=2918751 RepID=UPI00201B3FAF|nr:DUF6172 family protein [Aestuariirhabdus haliotis]MCL6415397.1 DUF6172 family protein [Aestuariirhabdus haliotis]MCL6419153.1 DUF6172 family protein [Aestuariirhabdus haliotis]
MKKTFALTHPKIKTPRLVDSIKHEAKKYLKRERNKALPQGVDYWDFDCKYGPVEVDAEEIHVSEINKYIDKAEQQQLPSFYLEILAKPGYRTKKETLWAETQSAEADSDVDDEGRDEEAQP